MLRRYLTTNMAKYNHAAYSSFYNQFVAKRGITPLRVKSPNIIGEKNDKLCTSIWAETVTGFAQWRGACGPTNTFL